MSNTINWGKIYEKTAWGIGVVTNTISWGKIYANLAGSIPSFALDFANIANDFTFTRNSSATFLNSSGLIETSTIDTPRIDYSTGEGAFLLEPQSTNLIEYSEDFSNSYWTISTATLTGGQLAPDGKNTAFKVEGNIGASWLLVGGFSSYATQRRSVYMRADSNGVVSALSDSQATQINVTTEWQRFDVQADAESTFYAVDFRGTGVTLDTVYIWGAQVEALPYATSYIPTNGSIATRSAELCVDATPTINSEEGVLYFEGSTLFNAIQNRYISISDGTTSNRVQFIFSSSLNRITVGGAKGGVGLGTIDYTSYTQTDNNKFAVVYSALGIKLFVNGVERGEIVVDASYTADTLTNLDFSLWNSASSPFYGNTKDLKIYDKALTDDELITLTTI